MNLIRVLRENVGWKIALVTSGSLLFVALLLIISFSVVPVQIFSKFNLIQILLVLVILLTFLSVLIIHISTVAFIQRPLDRLIQTIFQAEEGNLNVRATIDSRDEIGDLTRKFNRMLQKIGELDARKMKTERELILAQEELKYKQALAEKATIIEETNQQLARTINDLSILYRAGQMISAVLDLEELYNVLIEVMVKTLGFQEFALLVWDEESKKLFVKVAYGFKNNQKIKELSFNMGEGVSGQVALKQEFIYISDTSKDPLYLHYRGEKMEEGSFLSLPIVSHQRLLGVMNFSRPGIHNFSGMDIKLLTSLANQVAVSMENAKLYAKTKELSVTDDLTQVFNRRHFYNMLQMEWKRAKRFTRSVSLLMVDVDYFKHYNDTYGHLEGDRALQEIAKILCENVREVDTVSRYGGEEFAVILTHTLSGEAVLVAQKLCVKVSQYDFGGAQTKEKRSVTISVGVANFPEDAQNMEDLINHADIALYQAKEKGRNQVIVYQQEKSSGLRAV